jgi:hypothetical protein
MNEKETILESQLRECFGRVVYSHKTHEKQADIFICRKHYIKLLQITLAVLSTAGFITIIFAADKRWAAIAGAIISALLIVLDSYTKNFDYAELAQKHRHTASELWHVRELYLSLLTDLRMGNTPIERILTQRDELQKQLSNIYLGAPSTNAKATARHRLL